MGLEYTISDIQDAVRYRADLPSGRTGTTGAFTTILHASLRSLGALVIRSGGGRRLTYSVGLALRGLSSPSSGGALPVAYAMGANVGPHDVSGGDFYWKHRHENSTNVVLAPELIRIVKIQLVETGWVENEGIDPFTASDFASADQLAAALYSWSGTPTEIKPSSMESFGGENLPESWGASSPPTYRRTGATGLLFDPPPSTLSFIVIWYEGVPLFNNEAGADSVLLEPEWFDYVVADLAWKLTSRQADSSLWQQLGAERGEARASIVEMSNDDDANHAGGIRRLYDYGSGRLEGEWEPTA